MLQRFLLWMLVSIHTYGYCDLIYPDSFLNPNDPNLNNQPGQLQNIRLERYDPNTYTRHDFSMPSSQTINRRFKRNGTTNALEQLLEKSSIIARVANGISLQSGLMDGSIPVDAAVGELLNFGDAKVSDVVNFKSDNLTGLVGKLEELPKSLDVSAGTLENSTLNWNTRRIKSESIGDYASLSKKDDYLAKLKDFNDTFQFNSTIPAYMKLEEILDSLEKIGMLKDSDDPSYAYTKFSSLEAMFKPTIAELTNLSTTAADFSKKYKVLEEGQTIFASIGKMVEMIHERTKLWENSKSTTIGVFNKNFQQLDDLKTAFETSQDVIKELEQLVKNRLSGRHNKKVLTTAFVNGISDIDQLAQDMRDTWLIADKSVSWEKVAESMPPLFDFKSKVIGIDEKLSPVFTSGSSGAMKYLEKLKNDISGVPKESNQLSTFLKDIDTCVDKGKSISPSDLKGSEVVVAKIVEVGDIIKALAKSLKKVDSSKRKADFDNFIKFLGFTDIEEKKTSVKEVAGVIKKIKTTSNFASFKEGITELANGLNIKDATGIKTKIAEILSDQDNILFSGLKEEFEVYKCLRGHKDKFEKIVKAIDVTQKLRTIDVTEVQKVGAITTAVASISSELAGISQLVTSMKAGAMPDTELLNGLPGNISTAIGSSVSTLRNAHELVTLKSSIGDLKTEGAKVSQEINAIKDASVKTTIEGQWGNHDQDISSLEASILHVEDFEKTLNPVKGMADLGGQLLALQNLSDANINTKDKIQALESLIPTAKNPSDLQKSKDTLEHLDSLDLQFSSHKSSFQGASRAFQDLYNFLVSFSVQVPTNQNQKPMGPPPVVYAPASNAGKEEDKGPNYAAIFGGSGGALLGLVFGISVFVYFKYLKNRVSKKALRKWIRKQMFTAGGVQKYCDAYRCHEAYMKAMEIYAGRCDMEKSFKYLPLTKYYGVKRPVGCNPETALHHLKKGGQKMPIHANYVISPNGKKFIATQTPIAIPKDYKTAVNNDEFREDTREDFWHMCIAEGVENIVMLCCPDEINGTYFPSEVTDEAVKYGKYVLKTLSSVKMKGHVNVLVRKIEVTHTSGIYRKRVITHYNYIDWPDMKPPNMGNCKDVFAILKAVETSDSPVVVHCVVGIGRTMTFIGVHTATEGVKRNPNTTIGDELSKLREARWSAIQTIRQSYWLQVAVCHKLNQEFKLEMAAECKEILKTFIEVAFNDQGPEEVMVPRRKVKEDRKKAKEKGLIYKNPVNRKKDDEKGDFGVFIEF